MLKILNYKIVLHISQDYAYLSSQISAALEGTHANFKNSNNLGISIIIFLNILLYINLEMYFLKVLDSFQYNKCTPFFSRPDLY